MTPATVTSINSHPKRAYQALIPKSAVIAMQSLAGTKPVLPNEYSLRRTKYGDQGWCTEVWLHCDNNFNFNLSVHLDVWPKKFKDAREWVEHIESEYGLCLKKRKR